MWNDRVLVVMTLPRHERDQQITTESHLGVIGAGAVSERRPLLDPLASGDERALIDARALVRATELAEPVGLECAVVVGNIDQIRTHRRHHASLSGDRHVARIHRTAVLHTSTHERCFRPDQRHSLALHVRAHEGT